MKWHQTWVRILLLVTSLNASAAHWITAFDGPVRGSTKINGKSIVIEIRPGSEITHKDGDVQFSTPDYEVKIGNTVYVIDTHHSYYIENLVLDNPENELLGAEIITKIDANWDGDFGYAKKMIETENKFVITNKKEFKCGNGKDGMLILIQYKKNSENKFEPIARQANCFTWQQLPKLPIKNGGK